MAYGARLESVLGASPHGFESHILRYRVCDYRKPLIFQGFSLYEVRRGVIFGVMKSRKAVVSFNYGERE